MATPYFQVRVDSVASTQDEARQRLVDLPVVVSARRQTHGRGRSGAGWIAADRAVAVSVALRVPPSDLRPFSLMAGVAAARVDRSASLKWPNDLLHDEAKVGGILVERSGATTVIGLGLNLWWETRPDGMGSLFDHDPGPERPSEVGGLWAAELLGMVEGDGWPIEEYRVKCETIGREVSWDGANTGEAVDVAEDGGLVVRRDGEQVTLYSGVVRHLR